MKGIILNRCFGHRGSLSSSLNQRELCLCTQRSHTGSNKLLQAHGTHPNEFGPPGKLADVQIWDWETELIGWSTHLTELTFDSHLTGLSGTL